MGRHAVRPEVLVQLSLRERSEENLARIQEAWRDLDLFGPRDQCDLAAPP